MNSKYRIEEKRLEWIGSSYKDLLALPEKARKTFGHALAQAQIGERDIAAKVQRIWRCRRFGGR